jgi:monofunctional biosynthetic peptidoglycan transglycosylase
MLPSPRRFDRNFDSGYLARRTEVILRRMNAAELP